MNQLNDYSLIVPAAADKEFLTAFKTGHSGLMHCVEAVQGLPLQDFSAVYYTILRKHQSYVDGGTRIIEQLRAIGVADPKIVVLDEPARSQAETIAQTIRLENIEGGIFIKDADCYFRCHVSMMNGVAVFPLEDLDWVNPKDKSYVSVDDSSFVTNIIEKRIVSHLFSAGGYSFADAGEFQREYDSLAEEKGLYISHIIYRMLLRGKIFRPIDVEDYQDLNDRE